MPHKAVAEISKISNYRRLVAVKHGWHTNPLLDRKVIGGSARCSCSCGCTCSCDVIVVGVVVVVQ